MERELTLCSFDVTRCEKELQPFYIRSEDPIALKIRKAFPKRFDTTYLIPSVRSEDIAAIKQFCNVGDSATVEEITHLYLHGWRVFKVTNGEDESIVHESSLPNKLSPPETWERLLLCEVSRCKIRMDGFAEDVDSTVFVMGKSEAELLSVFIDNPIDESIFIWEILSKWKTDKEYVLCID